ncbi:hypothetical protein F947_01520 [Acinetobacter towneri DSM 14962 = CIP 107472]|nr:hypothetical protein F947_01520 [Acinetobacter towneri DSM 14962 = CIP 107472]
MDTDIRTFSQNVKEDKKVVSTKIAFYLVTSLFFMWGLQVSVIHQLKCLCDKPFKMSCF